MGQGARGRADGGLGFGLRSGAPVLADAQAAARSICKLRYEAFGCAGQAAKIKPLTLDKMAERYKKGELNQIVN